MAHFRTMLTSEHFCAADLWSEQAERYVDINVQIIAVSKGEVVGEKGRKKGMPFIEMRSEKTGKPIPKKLGLNATNCDTVAAIVGSPDVKRWPEQWLTLYVTKTEMGREQRDAIRIRPTAPKIGKPASEPAPPEPGAQYGFDPEATGGRS